MFVFGVGYKQSSYKILSCKHDKIYQISSIIISNKIKLIDKVLLFMIL